jgi:GNAT superfamily N-acetyltransferase
MADTILTDATTEQLGNAVEDALNALFRAMMILPGGEIVEREDVSYHLAFPINPMFKGVWATRLTQVNADAVIDETLAWFKARNSPFVFWWVTPRTQPANLPEHLLTHGFQVFEKGDPGMAVELSALNENIRTPEGFRIVKARTEQEILDWRDTFLTTFEVPEWAGQAWADATMRLGAENAPWKMYVGYLNDKPVATNMLFLGGGVASVYAVGTIPEARGQGIGAAITLQPLLDARAQGYKYGVLFSTEMGHPVYRRLGFRDVDYKIGRYLWINS